MSRRNRVDPFGDLHAVAERGRFTGNRGCLVDDVGQIVRHHRGTLWIACRTEFRGRRVGLARPRRWTPIFFLDDAVALAAGHRPCGECRHGAYRAYRDAVGSVLGTPVRAGELNRRLTAERFARRGSAAPVAGPVGDVPTGGDAPAGGGSGDPADGVPGHLSRAADRRTWRAPAADLPDGTVVLAGAPRLLLGDRWFAFSFAGWHDPQPRPGGTLTVLTPPTSVLALGHGFRPELQLAGRDAGARDGRAGPAAGRC
ncbi:MAG: hypothetical protein AB7J32_27135 [Pseudonocardia sp.]